MFPTLTQSIKRILPFVDIMLGSKESKENVIVLVKEKTRDKEKKKVM